MFDFFLPKFLFPSRKGSYIPIHFDEIVVKLYFLGFQVVVMFKNKEVGWLLKLMFLSILMMLVFSLVFFRLEADSNIIEMTKIRVREMASKNVRIISYHIQLCQTELDVLAEATEMSAKDDELQALLDTQLVKGHFDRITLYDSLRRPILSAHMEEQYAAERSELPSIRIGREVFFENNFICVMRPIEKDGIHVGYLLGEISEANFTKEINLTDHGDMGFANLITADGETLLVSNPSSILHMGSSFWDVFRSIRFKSPYSYHLMYEQISSQQPGYVYYYTTDGKPRMAYFEPAGYENWYIFQVASENAIEAQSAPLQMILIEVMLFMAIAYFVLIFITFTISKRYNRSLVEAQKQAEMLEKNIPGGVISFIPSENGEIDYISEGYLKILGMSRTAVSERYNDSFYRMVLPEDREKIRELLNPSTLYSDREFSLEYRLIGNEIEPIWVLDNMSVIRDAKGMLKIFSVIVDASAIKEKEQELHARTKNLEIVSSRHMESRVFEYDLTTQKIFFHKGLFLGYNLEMYNGLKTSEMLGKEWTDPQTAVELTRVYDELEKGNDFATSIIKLCHATTNKFHWVRVMLTRVTDENNAARVVGSLRDVTEEHEVQLKLSRETEKNRMMISNAIFTGTVNVTKNTLTIHSDGRGIRNNDRAVANYLTRLQVTIATRVHPEDVDVFLSEFNTEALLRHYNTGNLNRSVEYRRRLDGKEGFFWVRSTLKLTKDAATGDILCFVYINDIDRDIRIAKMLKQKAETDFLTGLYNREGLITRIKDDLEENGQRLNAFYSMDLDNFKYLNDSFGHLEGDRYLKRIGEILIGMFRKDDLIGRMGGDEFIIYLKNCPSEEFIQRKANEILQRISDAKLEGIDYQGGASLGIAIAPIHGTTFRELYDASDRALYLAKRSGKNKYALYQAEAEGESK